MHLEIEKNMYMKETQKINGDVERIRGEKERAMRELDAAVRSKQKGKINRLKKDIESILNREVKATIALNSMNAALQVVQKHINDLDGLPSPKDIKLIPLSGEIKVS